MTVDRISGKLCLDARSGVPPRQSRRRPRRRCRSAAPTLDAELEELAALEARRRRLLPESKGSSASRTRPATRWRARSGRGSTPRRFRRRIAQRAQQIKQLERRARDDRAAAQPRAAAICRTCRTRACRWGRAAADNVEVRRHGTPRDVRVHAAGALGSRAGARHHRLRARHQDRRRALLGAGRRRRAARARADQLHARTCTRRSTATPRSSRRSWPTRASLTGTGNLPKFEADLFKIAGDWDLTWCRPRKCR